ncbi:MAG TPA: 5'-nucleotidase, lipoprotein e(P4) family [Pyrinomonadaceae bacterium]|jgi:5'-nucleotidase (lipoprotein e(P4) family)|nr:5'-nucleotidase, lipoprotein e(P4) family [Pyrinomonadaceae bacterium]
MKPSFHLRLKAASIGAALLLCGTIVHAQQHADNTYIESATLYQQASGEARALEYQTYVLARMLLDRDLRNHRIRMRRAIIVDVDETILDNSRYQGMLIKRGVNYPEGWTDWCNRAEAPAIPGAVQFLNYAHSRGVRVFYVTNRKIAEKDGTARNLKNVGFPEVNDETLLVRTDTASDSKEPRRRMIASRYHVVLLMGDNLNDFSDVFEKSKTVEARLDATEKNKTEFGTHFIVLPNAMYGDWENAIYDYNFKLSSAEKQAKRRALLKD